MKTKTLKTALFLSALWALAACDSPRTQRSVLNSRSNSLNGVGLNPSNQTSTNTGTSTDTTSATTNSSVPEDAKHCQFSTDGVNGFASNSTHIGPYTLCKSSTDGNTFYFQLKTPPVGSNGDVNICFIPTTSSGSNSIYVGNPMCGPFNDPKALKSVTFVKYSSYTNAAINGVLFFKDTTYYYPTFNRYMMTLDAYQGCMNMLTYGNTAYCESFKSVGQYVYQTF